MLTISRDQLDAIGELSDKADNFHCASELPLPAAVHAEQLADGMKDIRDALRTLYRDITGEDPWSTV